MKRLKMKPQHPLLPIKRVYKLTNMGPFIARVFGALGALVALLSSYIFFQETGLYVLGSFVALVITHEASELTVRFKKTSLTIMLFIRALWLLFFYHYPQIPFLWLAILIDLCFWLWSLRLQESEKFKKILISSPAFSFSFYSLVCTTFVLAHLKTPEGARSLFSLLLIVLSFDTFSYFSGKLLGKKIFPWPLFPQCSPSKTIEGAFFGALCAGGFIMALDRFEIFPIVYFTESFQDFGLNYALLMIFCFLSLTGDLFESLLKREMGVKDSGKIMPGHGGLFDRLDGVLFTSILSYILLL